MFATIPGSVYFYHYYRAMKKPAPIDEKRVKWARRGVMIFAPMAMALVITAWTYEKTNHFENKLK